MGREEERRFRTGIATLFIRKAFYTEDCFQSQGAELPVSSPLAD